MASLISQMRNGQTMPQQRPQPQYQQPNLNASIEQVRGMMNMLKMSQNREQTLMGMIQQNPQFAQIAAMMKGNPGGLEGVARQMAQQNGIDINQLIAQLGGK